MSGTVVPLMHLTAADVGLQLVLSEHKINYVTNVESSRGSRYDMQMTKGGFLFMHTSCARARLGNQTRADNIMAMGRIRETDRAVDPSKSSLDAGSESSLPVRIEIERSQGKCRQFATLHPSLLATS